MVTFNPACYLPSAANNYIPSSFACPPPPSYLQSAYQTLISPFGSTYTTLRASMDALLSLPFLSFLLIPTMTSYSTSLNLLFFYLTWSTLVLSHAPLRVEIVGSLAIKILFYVLPSAFFLTFDILFPSISESFKSLGTAALPFRNLSRKRSSRHVKILAWSLGNILISITAQALLEYTLTDILGRRSALKVTTTLPLPWAIVKDLLRGFLLRDILTYFIHRYLLHSSSNTNNNLTRDLTTLHESWYHTQIRVPFPLSPTYDHPLIYLLRSFIPVYIPAMLWRFHLLTYLLYLLLTCLEDTFTYSGYASLPTNFVLGGIARRNDLHCLSDGTGNFGTWGVMDWVVGSSVGGDVAEDLVDEVRERELEGKVKMKTARLVQNASESGVGVEVRKRMAVNGRGKSAGGGRSSSSGGNNGGGEEKKVRRSRRSRTNATVDSDYEE